MRSSRALKLAAIVLVLGAMPATADESPFATIYTTEILPKGGSETEQWLTWKNGKSHEAFNAIEGRTEIEYGLTGNFQISAYANYDWTLERTHPITGPADSGTHFTGISAEAIYQVLNPFTDPIGLALYVEPRIGPGSREFETKVLLQKNFLDDRLVLAANLVLEDEWNLAPPDPTAPPGSKDFTHHWAKNTELNVLAGVSYRFAPSWFGGVEFASQREYDGLLLFQHSSGAANSFFFGPVLHYAAQNYWVTLGAQAQLPWAMNLSGTAGETVNHFAHEEERYRVRLRVGIAL
ncbi:MAG: hypothetical protein HY243_13615 [Proteobacteria bacterium]|nr:hypothetical protein [Pseudomonadota bacterium]